MKNPEWNLEWNKGMGAGIPEIDANHQRLIALIYELDRSNTEKTKATEIHKRLQHVIDDTKRHFELEEKFFQEWRYPDADVHASSHKLVLKILRRIQDSASPCGIEAGWPDAALKIKNLLVSHILAEDMQCELFQISRFERPSPKEKQEWHRQIGRAHV
jgi:hemerythrin-like metal-binding protein